MTAQIKNAIPEKYRLHAYLLGMVLLVIVVLAVWKRFFAEKEFKPSNKGGFKDPFSGIIDNIFNTGGGKVEEGSAGDILNEVINGKPAQLAENLHLELKKSYDTFCYGASARCKVYEELMGSDEATFISTVKLYDKKYGSGSLKKDLDATNCDWLCDSKHDRSRIIERMKRNNLLTE